MEQFVFPCIRVAIPPLPLRLKPAQSQVIKAYARARGGDVAEYAGILAAYQMFRAGQNPYVGRLGSGKAGVRPGIVAVESEHDRQTGRVSVEGAKEDTEDEDHLCKQK